ncbi:MAG TPA: nitrous oxide reductase accessory protein NosL [Terriglobia bacterium]|nr:nitrous oxide reductase accessory protein NosL [Terriglobia bacterium]
MRGKRLSITLLMIALAIGAAWLIHRLETPKQPAVCEICGRGIMKQVEFQIETSHGTIYACCPGCALHHIINNPEEARKELATDFDSGRLIPARSAYYDMGGDVQYCTRHDPALHRMPSGVEMRVYDRCLPTLVAFASKDDAEAYRQQHGGRVVTFDQALEEARGR